MSLFRCLLKECPLPEMFGEVMMREGLIDQSQLSKAIEHLQKQGGTDGAAGLARSAAELGFVAEQDVLALLDKVYGVQAVSLDDDLQGLIDEAVRKNFLARMRIPIRVKLSVTLAFFLLVTMLVLSYFMLQRQADNLYKESVKAGKISLNYFKTQAKVPLLNDDTLTLNSLINEAQDVEGVTYATIVDRDDLIKADKDLTRLGRKLVMSGKIGEATTEADGSSYFRRKLLGGEDILDISSPIEFQGKLLGTVHVGISLDFIQDRIENERVFIYMMTVVFFLIGMAVAGLLGTNFSRPISRLVVATKEISNGNFQHKVDFRRKDEFGDLGRAFNFMSHELWLKSIMRESFGRYVSTTIRDLILADPESMWLKGTKSEATILFADVRGFTKYSEANDPAVIVEHLNEFFDIAAKHIEKNNGYIDKFIGDEVLAVFGGLPDYQGDHAVNAVRAVWEMQRELASRDHSKNPVLGRVGASVNTGEVVSGNIGSEVRMEYTVIGDTVNVASRLNALAGANKMVLSESTFQRVKGMVATQMLQPQMVKGKSKPLQPYEVLDVLEPGKGPAPAPRPFTGDGVAAPPPPKAGPAAPPPPKTQPAPAAPQQPKAQPAPAAPQQPKAQPAPAAPQQQRPAPKPGAQPQRPAPPQGGPGAPAARPAPGAAPAQNKPGPAQAPKKEDKS